MNGVQNDLADRAVVPMPRQLFLVLIDCCPGHVLTNVRSRIVPNRVKFDSHFVLTCARGHSLWHRARVDLIERRNEASYLHRVCTLQLRGFVLRYRNAKLA